MNQKLLKFLKKPGPKPAVQSNPRNKTSAKSSLKDLPSPKESQIKLKDNKEPRTQANFPTTEEVSQENNKNTYNFQANTFNNFNKDVENTINTHFSSIYNVNNRESNTIFKEISEDSPLKLEETLENNENINRNTSSLKKSPASPLKMSVSRRNSKENLLHNINKDAFLSISSNTGSFISTDYAKPKEKPKKKDNKLGRFNGNSLNLPGFRHKNITQSTKIQSVSASDNNFNSVGAIFVEKNNTLTEVQEKNSEFEEKTEAKHDIFREKNAFSLPKHEKVPEFARKSAQPLPKFFHHFVSQRIFSDKSFAQQSERNPSTSRKKSVSKSKTSRKSPENTGKKLLRFEIFDFYIQVLQACEKVRFNVNVNSENLEETHDYSLDYIVNFEELAVESKEKEVYEVISSKFGKAFFYLIKKIFLIYATKKAEEMVVSQRQLVKFSKDFAFFKKIHGFSALTLQLMFSKQVQGKIYCNLRDFIEILYKIAKLAYNYTNSSGKESENHAVFKKFLEEYLVPCYRRINLMSLVFNVDNIQVFYKGQNPYENPTVNLLFQQDQLLKHVFSLYESYDLQKSQRPYVSLRELIRFCKDFGIVPYVCSGNQVNKTFLIFKEGDQETLSFKEFIMVLCCLAHIGQWKNEASKGFYQKMGRLFETISRANNNISDKLVLSKIIA